MLKLLILLNARRVRAGVREVRNADFYARIRTRTSGWARQLGRDLLVNIVALGYKACGLAGVPGISVCAANKHSFARTSKYYI